jgi:hypothetical protein
LRILVNVNLVKISLTALPNRLLFRSGSVPLFSSGTE